MNSWNACTAAVEQGCSQNAAQPDMLFNNRIEMFDVIGSRQKWYDLQGSERVRWKKWGCTAR